MLKRINEKKEIDIPSVRIADAGFPAPFRSGLEYSSPARGTWNIVHTGMLIPEAHEIFVCAAGCLRGVVLTAAEMGTMDRFSTVAVREHDLLDGDMEDLVIEGVSDIIGKLPKRPPAVLVYTSCVHHFTGCDLDMIYARLRERFPDIDFTDCYMNPIMRKSGLTPDQLMRSRLYMLLHEREKNPASAAIIGNDLPTDQDSDLMKLLTGAGLKVHEITSCRNYQEYQEMAESAVSISYNPDAVPGGKMLEDRLGIRHHYLKLSFDFDEIDAEFDALADTLAENCTVSRGKLDMILGSIRADGRAAAEAALSETLALVGSTPIAIDYTYCPRPLGLARFLLERGFNVKCIYADAIPGADKPAFDVLKEKYPDLILCPTVHAGMRFANTATRSEGEAGQTGGRCASECASGAQDTQKCDAPSGAQPLVIALGQKAAYFENTNHFANVVEGGGMIGYEAVTRTLGLIREVFRTEQNMRELVQVKGLGCEVCVR